MLVFKNLNAIIYVNTSTLRKGAGIRNMQLEKKL
jgi:hypothetical protein